MRWPQDVDIEKRYYDFIRRRKNGNEERVTNWSYEKYRYYRHICQGRSLVSGVESRTKLDIDRVIDTNGYDLDTVLMMESKINYAKSSVVEFMDSRAFEESEETYKAK
ncbi:hypothetical protein BGZ67_010063 [Mortierella alpina]|nr:hypothetical protein BGZ67_010063 [Mortierella alpina]